MDSNQFKMILGRSVRCNVLVVTKLCGSQVGGEKGLNTRSTRNSWRKKFSRIMPHFAERCPENDYHGFSPALAARPLRVARAASIDALEFSPARVAAARADLEPWMERSALKNCPMQLLC